MPAFDLVTYRCGALAELIDSPPVKRPGLDRLVSDFRRQREDILDHPAFKNARKYIEDEAKKLDPRAVYSRRNKARAGDPEDLQDSPTVFSMPPSLGIIRKRRANESSHLVGLLPNDHLRFKLGGTPWSVRIRASTTACALEVANGYPKLWWTFEGVHQTPQLGNQLTEKDAVSFLRFVRDLEEGLLEHLKDAYFGALLEVTHDAREFKHKLSKERLRIRFADDNDEVISALIETLRYRNVAPMEIRSAKKKEFPTLQRAKQGMLEFEQFVRDTNSSIEPAIDPKALKPEVRVFGVEAVVAGQFKGRVSSIAGLAQQPDSRTTYDHLRSVRERRIAKRTPQRIRAASASRRLSAQLAGHHALLLDDLKRNGPQSARVALAHG